MPVAPALLERLPPPIRAHVERAVELSAAGKKVEAEREMAVALEAGGFTRGTLEPAVDEASSWYDEAPWRRRSASASSRARRARSFAGRSGGSRSRSPTAAGRSCRSFRSRRPAPPRLAAAIAAGRISWSGGKPLGDPRAARVRGRSVADAVLEDRR